MVKGLVLGHPVLCHGATGGRRSSRSGHCVTTSHQLAHQGAREMTMWIPRMACGWAGSGNGSGLYGHLGQLSQMFCLTERQNHRTFVKRVPLIQVVEEPPL